MCLSRLGLEVNKTALPNSDKLGDLNFMSNPQLRDNQDPEAKRGNANKSFLKKSKDNFVHLPQAEASGRQSGGHLMQVQIMTYSDNRVEKPR